jgi:hypothetical protein
VRCASLLCIGNVDASLQRRTRANVRTFRRRRFRLFPVELSGFRYARMLRLGNGRWDTSYESRAKSRSSITYSRVGLATLCSWRSLSEREKNYRVAPGTRGGHRSEPRSVGPDDRQAGDRRRPPGGDGPVDARLACRWLALDLPSLGPAAAVRAAQEHRAVFAPDRVLVAAGQLARQPIGHRRPAARRCGITRVGARTR